MEIFKAYNKGNKGMELKEGIFEGISFDEYRALDAINQSGLANFRKCPAYYKWKLSQPQTHTESTLIGVAAHALFLTPEQFSDEIAVLPPCDRRTNEGKRLYNDFTGSNPGKLLIKEEQLKTASEIVESAWKITSFLDITKGKNELTLVWIDPQTSLWCKARLDSLLIPSIWDFKTSRTASPAGFARHAEDWGYYHQAAWYMEACRACGLDARRYSWIVVETSEPYLGAVYEASELDLYQCASENQSLLLEFAKCKKSDKWPGYESGVLQRPAWATKQYEDLEAA